MLYVIVGFVSRIIVVSGFVGVYCVIVGGWFSAVISVHFLFVFAPCSSVIIASMLYVPGVFGVSVVCCPVLVSVVPSGFVICHLYVMLSLSGSVAVMLYVVVCPVCVVVVSCVGVYCVICGGWFWTCSVMFSVFVPGFSVVVCVFVSVLCFLVVFVSLVVIVYVVVCSVIVFPVFPVGVVVLFRYVILCVFCVVSVVVLLM